MRIQNIGNNMELFTDWINLEVLNLTYTIDGEDKSTKENSVCWVMKNVWGNDKATCIREDIAHD